MAKGSAAIERHLNRDCLGRIDIEVLGLVESTDDLVGYFFLRVGESGEAHVDHLLGLVTGLVEGSLPSRLPELRCLAMLVRSEDRSPDDLHGRTIPLLRGDTLWWIPEALGLAVLCQGLLDASEDVEVVRAEVFHTPVLHHYLKGSSSKSTFPSRSRAVGIFVRSTGRLSNGRVPAGWLPTLGAV